jgi:hypothetical protein
MDGENPSSIRHRCLSPTATTELSLDRRFYVVRRIITPHLGILLLGRNVLQAENVLVGRDKVHDLLIGRLGLGRTGQGADQIPFQAVEVDILVSNFTQGNNGVLVVVAIQRQFFAACDVPRPLRGQEDQLKAVRNLHNAIFNGDTRHPLNLRRKIRERAE